MTPDGRRDPEYVLGRSQHELHGLEERARLFNPPTLALLKDAGISDGMKVLDIGCGPGDVTLLVGGLVGGSGEVVGVDLNPEMARVAATRAKAQGMQHLSFIAGDIRDVALPNDSDAVVGRLVLMYSEDPTATLREALKAVKANGRAAFYEMNMGSSASSYPLSPLHQWLGEMVTATFARGGGEMAMGTKLHEVFVGAGLEAPHMRTDALIGAGEDFAASFASFGATLLRGLLPKIVEYRIATEPEIGLETFEQRYRDEVVGLGSVVQWLSCVGAWSVKRHAN